MPIGSIGKYERLDVLGHGSSGVVYLAWDTLLRRNVALKEIRADGPEMERVLEEARVLDRLRHPHIVHVNGVDVADGVILIDMELVQGRNLSDILRERGGEPLPPSEAVRIALSVLDALGYAHERRIIHRDIKPANILIANDGSVKLTDFGLAEALGSGSVAGGGGTYPYMAPEDFAEDDASDYRSDLWAVGVVLYEMLTGRRPFLVQRPKDPFSWKRAVEGEDPPRPTSLRPGLPIGFDEILYRALAKDKARRFPTAQVFADALRAVPVERAERVTAVPLSGEPEPFVFSTGTVCYSLDDLLPAASRNWNEARGALADGRVERFLRGIGEVYIAELAAGLSGRAAAGENADRLLREFLDRSRPEDVAAADALATLPVSSRPLRVGASAADGSEEGSSSQQRRARMRMRRTPPRPARLATAGETLGAGVLDQRVAATEQSVFATVPAGVKASGSLAWDARVPGPEREHPHVGDEGSRLAKPDAPAVTSGDAPRLRWWFWPSLALCLGPPAAMLTSQISRGYSVDSATRVMEILGAWSVTGFLAAILLLVAIGINMAGVARFLAFIPMAAGLIAAGALASTMLGGDPNPDALVRVGVGMMLPVIVLLFQAGTMRRLWRLWLGVSIALSIAVTLLFLGPVFS